MSTTPRPPLLSDEELQTMSGHGEMTAWEKYIGEAVRDRYEAARANDAELIQRLVNELVMLQYVFASETGYETLWGDDALAAAAAAGFKPTEP